MVLPKSLKIGIVLVVVVVFVLLFLPSFSANETGFTTSLLVGTAGGEREVEVYTETPDGLFPQSIVTLSGTPIDYFRWVTDFQAVSDQYDRYDLIQPSFVKAYLLTPTEFGGGGVPCGGPLVEVSPLVTPLPTDLSIGIQYSVGVDFMGHSPTEDHTIKVWSSEIVAHIVANSCPLSGDYSLRYRPSVTVQARGLGELPTDSTDFEYRTIITLEEGTITAVDVTSKESG